MGSSSSPSPSSPPPPMIGRAGNLTVFITPPSPASTPRSSRPSESRRTDSSTSAYRAAPPPTASPSLQKTASPPAPPVKFSPPAPPVKVAPPPVQVPPLQYEKASAGGKHDGSAFGFFWDAVSRVHEAHASLDEYVANWFGLDQSKYQWALNDYYESTGKDSQTRDALRSTMKQISGYGFNEVECSKAGKPKEFTTTKVQKV